MAGLGAVALAAAGIAVTADEPEASFCTADGLIGPNGELYGRRHPDCQFVDAEGELVTEFRDGRDLCYVVPADGRNSLGQTADCDNAGPGVEVRRPG